MRLPGAPLLSHPCLPGDFVCGMSRRQGVNCPDLPGQAGTDPDFTFLGETSSYAASSRSAAAGAGSSPASTASRTSSRIRRTPVEWRSRWSSSSRTSAQVNSSCCWARFPARPSAPSCSRWASTRPHRSSTPMSCSPETVTTGGAHSPLPCTSRRAPASSRAAALASSCRSPSALLTAITSAISRMPFLIPCSWSPVRARVRNRNVSTIPATVTSDWPTPTVSTSTTSYAAASSTAIAWTVARATPPRVPAAGEGRMKAFGLADSFAIRVLSPSTEPPVRMLDGSTARTPTRWPCAVSRVPSDSMKVDFPTPGTPETPTRTAGERTPEASSSASVVSRSRAAERCSRLDDSTSVIACDTADRRCARMPSRSTATSGIGAPRWLRKAR